MEICETDYAGALDFFLEHRGFDEGVTFTDQGSYFIARRSGVAVGMCSTNRIGKWLRIKSLFVPKKYRGSGVATELVTKLSANEKCTAFAFNSSRNIFANCGFTHERTGKNGIHFMRKQ